jgi:signal transduction histidine kinase/streptogramin lyase/CheY-like chemotaxis protein
MISLESENKMIVKYWNISRKFGLLSGMLCVFFMWTGVFAMAYDNNNTPVIKRDQVISQSGNSMRFTRYFVEDGLAANTVHSIFQDSNGMMWLGTQDGLNSYDGNRFTIYKNDPDNPNSLSDNVIRAVIEDRHQKILWIGTQRGGLNRYDLSTETFTHFRHDPDNPNSLSGNDILTLFQDTRGRIWIGTEKNGMTRFDPKTMTFERFVHNPGEPDGIGPGLIWKVLVDQTETVWACNAQTGLYRLTPDSHVFKLHTPVDDLKSVRTIYREDTGALWVGTKTGSIVVLDETTGQFLEKLGSNPVNGRPIDAIVKDTNGHMWIGTVGNGMYRFDPRAGNFIPYQHQSGNPTSLSGDRIRTIFISDEGVVWVGMRNGGMSTFSLSQQKFTLYQNNPADPHSLFANMVYSVHEDRNGNLWAGNAGGVVNRLDPATNRFSRYRLKTIAKDAAYVHCIYEDPTGTLWVTGWNLGVQQYRPETDTFEIVYQHIPGDQDSLSINNAYTLFMDRTGALWVGSAYGALDRINPEKKFFQHYTIDTADPHSYSDNETTTIYEDRQGILWMGTFSGGLNRYDREKDRFDVFRNDQKNPRSITLGAIYSLYEDRTGRLWVGTANGLNLFAPNKGTFTRYTQKDGLPNNVINGILGDRLGNLWLSTNRGLSRFTPQTGKFRNYDVSYGLQGNEFRFGASFLNHAGRMYFGGSNGLSAFFPDQITDNPFVPPVLITELRIFDHPVPVAEDSFLQRSLWNTDSLTFSPKDGIISFEYAALSYVSPSGNRYAYKMEGFDKEWIHVDSSRRFATYTNLDPGSYTFRIKASNNDNIWNETGKSLKITVLPPWWETVWFRSLASLIILGLLFSVYLWRMSAIKIRSRALELQVTERTRDLTESESQLRQAKEQAEAANQAKSAFLANMSHDLRTPMNAVLGFSEILFHRERDPQKKNYLKSIQTNGKALLSLINDVLDLSKIEAGKLELQYTAVSIQNLFEEMSSIFQYKIREKGLEFEVKVDADLPESLLLDETRVRQVLMNLLGNAIKFTDEGFIRFSCREEKNEQDIKSCVNLIIEVTDSGRGIPAEDQESIFNPFEQVTGQKTSQYGGTGLGLAITKNIIKMMNGNITVKSKPGHGSTFRIELKDVEVTVKMVGETKNDQDVDPDLIKFFPAKVLIVDDIDYNRDVLTAYLDLFNLTLYFAETGKVAIEQAQKYQPDLILMDMKMPVMDGYEASKLLKSGDSTGGIPIIAVTASALVQDEEKIRQHCDAYLSKPVSQFELVKEMKKFLKYTEEEKTIPEVEVGTEMAVPAEVELKKLYEVALDGNMDGITAYLDKLERKDKNLKEFCAQLRTLAITYKDEKIIGFLKELL